MCAPLRFFVIFSIKLFLAECDETSDLNLPPEHVSYYFTRFPDYMKKCSTCHHFENSSNSGKCWGYENSCDEQKRTLTHECFNTTASWTKNLKDQLDMFWTSADFGYISKRLSELYPVCKPQKELDSFLICAKHMRYCRASNLYMDFSNARLKYGSERFREDIFKTGEIGGRCSLDKEKLCSSGNHKSPLQSWYAEFENYSELKSTNQWNEICDVILDKPTIFMKLDAGVNLYHHFCDFINLYASQHINGSFQQDIQIVMWDTSPMNYGDLFASTWKAFTIHPIIHLNTFDGKRVCVKDALFSLLPRMRYGLYYNMPLIPGCWKSSLFRAFSRHITYRLGVNQMGPLHSKVRVTLLTRSTKYRRILNQNELLSALLADPNIEATMVDYNREISFLDQLYVTHNTDVFIGIHGAGLTHLLFLPNWAAVFELYHCDDKACYYDLARLRGVKYFTWENMDKITQEDEGHHPTLGDHKKFTNYSFDVNEFMRLVLQAVKYVQHHPEFVQAQQEKWKQSYNISEIKSEL